MREWGDKSRYPKNRLRWQVPARARPVSLSSAKGIILAAVWNKREAMTVTMLETGPWSGGHSTTCFMEWWMSSRTAWIERHQEQLVKRFSSLKSAPFPQSIAQFLVEIETDHGISGTALTKSSAWSKGISKVWCSILQWLLREMWTSQGSDRSTVCNDRSWNSFHCTIYHSINFFRNQEPFSEALFGIISTSVTKRLYSHMVI